MLLRLLLLSGGVFATGSVAFSQFSPPSLFQPKTITHIVVTPPAATDPDTIIVSTSTTTPTIPTTPPITAIPSVAAATVTLDFSRPYTSVNSGPAVVKKETFGGVYTTFLTIENYNTSVAQAPNYSLRWPGGSFAEANTSTYSLTFPDIYFEPAPGETGYDKRTQKGLTDVMAYAVERNIPFVMVIPTRPYFNNVTQGQTDLRNFLTKLLRGDFGTLPTSFTLEIGNETASAGWLNNKFTPGPGSYGFVANAFLTTINSVVASPTLNPTKRKIDAATWIGSTEGGQNTINNQISTANMRTIDGFVHHIGLVENGREYDFATSNRKFATAKKYWNAAWGSNVPEFKLIATEWNVGGSSLPDEPAEYAKVDIGARQAGTVVNTFAQMIGGGLDTGMLWGIQNRISSMLWFKDKKISHGGQAFRLMSESLVGTQLLSGKVNARGFWTRTATTHDVIAYRNATSTVIFLSAADIPASGLNVTFTLSNFGTIKNISTEAITTMLTNPGQPWPEDDRAYEDPIVSKGSLAATAGKFTYKLTQDYEVVRIIVTR